MSPHVKEITRRFISNRCRIQTRLTSILFTYIILEKTNSVQACCNPDSSYIGLYPRILTPLDGKRFTEQPHEFFHGILVIAVLEYVHASCHLIVGHFKRHGLYIAFVVYGIFGQDSYELCLTYTFFY